MAREIGIETPAEGGCNHAEGTERYPEGALGVVGKEHAGGGDEEQCHPDPSPYGLMEESCRNQGRRDRLETQQKGGGRRRGVLEGDHEDDRCNHRTRQNRACHIRYVGPFERRLVLVATGKPAGKGIVDGQHDAGSEVYEGRERHGRHLCPKEFCERSGGSEEECPGQHIEGGRCPITDVRDTHEKDREIFDLLHHQMIGVSSNKERNDIC